MRLAMAQMRMSASIDENLKKTLDYMDRAKAQGAELILIPTANIVGEPLELFEWEVRVQSFQNTVFTAMCNRVGPEGKIVFAGQSLVAGPEGGLLFKADGAEKLLLVDVPLEKAAQEQAARPWLRL